MENSRGASLAAFLLLFALFLGLVLWMCAPYLLALFVGQLMALLLGPIYRRFCRRLPRQAASALATMLMTFLVVAPLSAFATLAVREGISFASRLADDKRVSLDSLDRALRPLERALGEDADLKARARETVRWAAEGSGAAVLSLIKDVPKILLQLALALLSCFFFLIDGGRFLERALRALPLDPDLHSDLLAAFRETAVSTVWAGMAAAVSQSAVVLAGFLALGIPSAFLASGLTFIFTWIPMLGTIPAMLAGAAYLYSEEAFGRLIVLAGVGLIAGLVDNLVRPLVLRGRQGIHPLVSLVAIFGGIHAFGIMGVFVGPVLAAVLVALFELWPVVERRAGLGA